MMQLAATRSSQLMNLYGVLVLMAVVVGGAASVYLPTAAVGGSVMAAGGIAALVLIRKSNILVSAMLCYGLLLALPALLPRAGEDRENPALGGALDTRALMQLAIFAMVILVGCWLWLVAGAGVANLIRFPLLIMVLYVVLVGISLMYTPEIAWPAYGLFKLTALVVVITVLSAVVKTASQLKRVIDLVVGALMLVLLIYLFDVARGAAPMASGRFRANWIHPNQITLLAVTVMLILTVRFLASSTPNNRAKTIPLIGLAAIAAMLAGSKSSLGAAAIALVVATLVILIKKPTGSMLARIMALVLGAFGVINYFLVNNLGIVAHLNSYEESGTDPASLTGRVPVWNTALTETLSTPFTTFLGHGYLSTYSIGLEGYFWTARQAHNSFVQTFFDLGLIGVVLVAILYISSWIRSWQAISRYNLFDPRWVRALELLTLLTAFTVVSLTEDIMGGTVESHTMILLIVMFCVHRNLIVTLDDSDDPEPNPNPAGHNMQSPTQMYLDRVSAVHDTSSGRDPGEYHANSAGS